MTLDDEQKLAQGIEQMGIDLVGILKEIREDIAEIKKNMRQPSQEEMENIYEAIKKGANGDAEPYAANP